MAAVGAATEGVGGVEAIGVSGQMHGVVLADDEGSPLRSAILWADFRSADELRRYKDLSAEVTQRLANPIVAGMAGPSLLWLRAHERQNYCDARWALQPKDWLRMVLCGEACTEPSDASATLLYDVFADGWDHELIELLGLDAALLAPLIPSTSVAGELGGRAARELGLSAGIPVAAGAADTAAAMVGTGMLTPGPPQLTVGTGAQIVNLRHEPEADATRRTHLYRAVGRRSWYSMAAVQNAGLALEWVRGIFGITWERFYEEALSVASGCSGVVFLPYLSGERTPHLDPQARGRWVGLSSSHTRAHLLRAALEGVAFAIREALEALQQSGVNAQTLRLAGGGSLNPGWRRMLADILNRPLRLLPDSTAASASALGAALLGGVGAGCYENIGEAAGSLPRAPESEIQPRQAVAYEEAYRAFKEAYR